MFNRSQFFAEFNSCPPKPLAIAIKTLLLGGVVMSGSVPSAHAELPVPRVNVHLGRTPVDIATQGRASATVDGNALTIHQQTDKATVDWKSFNIGAGNSVRFEQPSATAVALNNIHQNDASQILGSLTANGQVYLVNQNGFLFGPNSSVNVNSLVASTLGISADVFQTGITKVFDLNKKQSDYTNTAAALKGDGELFLKDNAGNPIIDQNGNKVKIQIYVQPGAQIKTNAAGGRVILAAPSITNAGTIETPDGQTILAAATDKVYLQEADSNSDIRGLLVEVGTGGDVNNVGKVLAERGNVSLIGFAVNQNGVASATTSVQLNGTVRLLAREGIKSINSTADGALLGAQTKRQQAREDGLGTSAKVELGNGSVTSVELDADKSATAIDAQTQAKSRIEISGHKVILHGGSTVRAKSGTVQIAAIDSLQNTALKGDARVLVEQGSLVDVSGVKKVSVSVARNVVTVELRKNELRDAPLQRDGVLYGKKVAVNLRKVKLSYDQNGNLQSASIPIADVKGAVDRIARNIDERSTSGGSINIQSSGDVVTQAGSVLDVSGGSIDYQSGVIQTTRLISDHRLYGIESASPDRFYSQISKLGGRYYEAGYQEGKAGGNININAYQAVLDGDINGAITIGKYQRSADTLPLGSSLFIDLQNGNTLGKQNVVFTSNAVLTPISPYETFPGGNTPYALLLNTSKFRSSRLRNLRISTNGSVSIDSEALLELPEFGNFTVSSQNFDLQGRINAPSGQVLIKPVSDGGNLLPNAITLGSKAVIDVSGLWINDLKVNRNTLGFDPIAINGGTVGLFAEQADLILSGGSFIDANGGALRARNGRMTAGNAGEITLSAASHDASIKKGSVFWDPATAGITARGLKNNGKLFLETNEIVLGVLKAHALTPNLSPLVLTEDFFNEGGFSSYSLKSNVYGVNIGAVHLGLRQQNLQLIANGARPKTGSRLRDITQLVTLPDENRNSVSLNVSLAQLSEQNPQQVLSVDKGAVIETDIGGNVTFSSDTSIWFDGTIKTPGGNITFNINQPVQDKGFFAGQSIWLGANSRLLAQGAYKTQFNINGWQLGDVLPGGTIALNANRGYLVSQSGSVIDVSGSANLVDKDASGNIDLRQIASSAGTIALQAGEGMLLDGGFVARGGSAESAGGTLSVAMDRFLRVKPDPIPDGGAFPDDTGIGQSRIIKLTASDSPTIRSGLKPGDAIDSSSYSGIALLHANAINSGGFDSLILKTDAAPVNSHFSSAIAFDGGVTLNAGKQIVLDSPSLISDGNNVTLNTVYAALGSGNVRNSANVSELAPTAVGGLATFNLNAKGIDLIGGLGFNGFSQVNLHSTGDFRLRGVTNNTAKDFLGQLNVNGDLNITSAQLYPATLTDYTINVTGANHTVSFNGGGGSLPVFSAGGHLTVNAANIYQNALIKAPFGQLTFNATNTLSLGSNSVTSVSGGGSTVLFGRVAAGTDWLYPLNAQGSRNIVVNAPPEKRIDLNGKDINLNAASTIDLSGGGQLYSYEFISGPGGSNDVLDATASKYTQNYAVLPGYYNVLTPFDPFESSISNSAASNSVYLNGGGSLTAGWYTLLPAHFALLPGAFLVTPLANTVDQVYNTTDIAGTALVAGRYGVAGTSIQNARTQAFAVETGSMARTRSEYTNYYADGFFTAKAEKAGTEIPQLSQDAGTLAITAQTSLTLASNVVANQLVGGRGGAVDISANRLEVVGSAESLSSVPIGTVGILASDLNRLHVPSLLLGGKRGQVNDGLRITAKSSQVKVDSNANLQGQEILLTAIDNITIASGATVTSTGRTGKSGGSLLLDNQNGTSDAALIRVSDAGQVDVVRDKTVTGTTGEIVVQSGAQLNAQGSMLLDSSKNTVFNGSIGMNGGSLALNSSQISLGNAPVNTTGLVMKDFGFTLDELRLKSAGALNFYGGVALNTQRLLLSVATINGFNNSGLLSSVNADVIELSNSGLASNTAFTGTGRLDLNANEIHLGSGQYAINGFGQVNLNASRVIKGLGQTFAAKTGDSTIANPGLLKVAGNVALNTQHITGDNGATTALDARGYAVTLNALAPTDAVSSGLGVRWAVTGNSISGSVRFDLPSGILELTALNGGINLNSGSRVDLSGRIVEFADTYQASDAGKAVFTANNGDISLGAGASIDVSGAVLGNRLVSKSGSLSLKVESGVFNWNGSIRSQDAAVQSDATQGQFSLNALRLDNSGFSGLVAKLAASGFNEAVSIHTHSQDITIAANDRLRARNIDLQADQGAINIAGVIDASAAQAGDVSIYGRNGIVLGATGSILARSTGSNAGGNVLLDTVHRDNTGTGVLDLSASGGLIDVSGGNGGGLHLRTGRTGNSVAVTDVNSTITGSNASHTALEATKIYNNETSITTAKINTWRNETNNFMNARPDLTNNSGTYLEILPGIEVRSSGDLTLTNKWDFMTPGQWSSDTASWVSDWRYNDVSGEKTLPGFLTLNAAGNLNINASLTDALATTPVLGQDEGVTYQDMIQPGLSWSYRLLAGGNISLAASSIVNNNAQQVVVRTGTGTIDVKAGNNITLNKYTGTNTRIDSSNSAAAIYTVGTTALYTRSQLLAGQVPGISGLVDGQSWQNYLSSLSPDQLNTVLRYGLYDDALVGRSQDDDGNPGFMYAEYPVNGGSINLYAGGTIQGAQTGQKITDWLVRNGAADGDNQRPTAWGINISGDHGAQQKSIRNFNMNIGALGGGNVNVTAAGDIRDLSAVIPTTGKPLGILSEPNVWVANGTTINGGGNLRLTAGSSVYGGEYYTGKGRAEMIAGNSINESAVRNNGKAGVLLNLGDASFSLKARNNIYLAGVTSPTVLRQTKKVEGSEDSPDSLFFTYGPDSAVNLLSVAGNVVFQNNLDSLKKLKDFGSALSDSGGFEYFAYPAQVRAASLTGDLKINGSMALLPSATGDLKLLASNNVGSDSAIQQYLMMSDVDPNALPNISKPAQNLGGSKVTRNYLMRELLDPSVEDKNALHALASVYLSNNEKPLIMAKFGNIQFSSDALMTFYMPKASSFIAGNDISNLSISGQNLNSADLTLVKAGGNLSYDSAIDDNGVVKANTQKIELGGAGSLAVLAGKNINLGSSDGITTIGNLYNSALTGDVSASINILAGLSDVVDYRGFVAKYQQVALYSDRLNGLLNLDNQQLIPHLDTLLSVLFEEIKQSAAAAAAAPEAQRTALYQQGFDAISALFPANGYQGNLNMVYSQIKSFYSGNINIAIPGGKIDVGLAGKQGGLSKSVDQLGIVNQGTGNVNLFARNNINVNQSRVFAMGGGDVVGWSSKGDVDAGKGAKSSISAPKPKNKKDAKGNIVTIFPPIVSGSGIQAIGGGSVYLAAPEGVIDAGEAGISGNKVIIAATAVIGASNIQSTGGTVGVPTTAVAAVVPTGAEAAAASAAKSSTQDNDVSKNDNSDAARSKLKSKVTVLSADVVGFGGCSVGDVKEGKQGCGG